jgi:hypothetical protein
MEIDTLSSAQVRELRNRVIREFHLRPSYLWKKVTDIRSPREFWRALQNAYALLQTTFHKSAPEDFMDGDM